MRRLGRFIASIKSFIVRLFHKIFREDDPDERPWISIIIPFREGDDMTRDRVFKALTNFYGRYLPEAEIIIGRDPLNAYPFNKSRTINEGFERCRGDIIAVVDADCLIDPNTIRTCAYKIETKLDEGEEIWCMPYSRFYRLTKAATLFLIQTGTVNSELFSQLGDPPIVDWLEPSPGASTGHRYGALVQIMPREAFELVGGWDEDFAGWGSEDVSMMYALDTLYGHHLIYNGPVYHMWHHYYHGSFPFTRQWVGQRSPEANWNLARAYEDASYDRVRMSALVYRDQTLVEEV